MCQECDNRMPQVAPAEIVLRWDGQEDETPQEYKITWPQLIEGTFRTAPSPRHGLESSVLVSKAINLAAALAVAYSVQEDRRAGLLPPCPDPDDPVNRLPDV